RYNSAAALCLPSSLPLTPTVFSPPPSPTSSSSLPSQDSKPFFSLPTPSRLNCSPES
ncbi:hypothetical protein U1Q18_012871, partial [Sarracenia purpurea var. burkii]